MTETQIIAALANACGLKWARCHICGERPASCFGKYESMSEREPSCDDCCGHACEDGHCDELREMTLEEWAAEHPGEPGPVREWTSEDGRVWWVVGEPGLDRYLAWVAIRVGRASARLWSSGWGIHHAWGVDSADVADLARMMEAVDRDKAGAP